MYAFSVYLLSKFNSIVFLFSTLRKSHDKLSFAIPNLLAKTHCNNKVMLENIFNFVKYVYVSEIVVRSCSYPKRNLPC